MQAAAGLKLRIGPFTGSVQGGVDYARSIAAVDRLMARSPSEFGITRSAHTLRGTILAKS